MAIAQGELARVHAFEQLKKDTSEISVPYDKLDPAFRVWVSQCPPTQLIKYCSLIIAEGYAATIEQALVHLSENAKPHRVNHTPQVAGSDRNGNRKIYLYSEIEKLFGREVEKPDAAELWAYGRVSHQAIPELLSGRLPADKIYSKSPLEDIKRRRGFAGDRINWATAQRIKNASAELGMELADHNTIGPHTQKVIAELHRSLALVFGEHAKKLGECAPAIGIERYVATLRAWAAAIEFAKTQKPRALFTETRLFPYATDINGGRPDALEVISINGDPPTAKQQALLFELTNYRYGSWVEILRAITKAFGPDIKARPVDWKVEIDGPLTDLHSKYVDQVKEYITFGTIASLIAFYAHSSDIWPEASIFEEGELTYFGAGKRPTSHRITLPSYEQQLYMSTHHAPKMPASKANAIARTVENSVARYLISISTGRAFKEPPQVYNLALPWTVEPSVAEIIDRFKIDERQIFLDIVPDLDSETLESIAPAWEDVPIEAYDAHDFEKDPDEEKALREVIFYRAEPKYRDEEKILQIGHTRNGDEFLLVNYKGLLESINNGRPTRNFHAKTGGYVCCFAHSEKSPSCWVRPDQRKVHCFGCGANFLIAQESIPEDLNVEFSERKRFKSLRDENGEIVIPEEHSEVLQATQDLLQRYFSGSLAERYLARERKIDPAFAYAYGAGYATNRTLIELLLAGYTYEQMKQVGLFGYSMFSNTRGGATQVLKRHGLTEEQVMVDGKYPFFILCDRLTFPLKIEEKMGSFYGRALWNADKKMAHVKTLERFSGIPHPAHNIDAIWSGTDEIEITEGIIDQLTLASMGIMSVALVGTHNFASLLEIARSKNIKRIGLALDNDGGGKTVTAKLYVWLREVGYEGEVYDFTRKFIEEHPEMAKYDDWNTMWVRELYKKHRKAA